MAIVDWASLAGSTPIINRNIVTPVTFRADGRDAAPGGALLNRTPNARTPQGPAAVLGVLPIPNQPGWSVDRLLCDHAIAGYHGEVQALVNRGMQPHEAHAFLRDHKPELMGAIRRYSEAAMANARQAEATPGERRGRQALKDFRAEVEALCNRGVKYHEAVRQVNETRGDLVAALKNSGSAAGGDDQRSDENKAMDAFFEKVKATKAKHGAAMTWGQAWLMTVEEHRGEYEAAGKPETESALSNFGHQAWER